MEMQPAKSFKESDKEKSAEQSRRRFKEQREKIDAEGEAESLKETQKL
jgi:hypothetical protein